MFLIIDGSFVKIMSRADGWFVPWYLVGWSVSKERLVSAACSFIISSRGLLWVLYLDSVVSGVFQLDVSRLLKLKNL